jgi:nitroreductase
MHQLQTILCEHHFTMNPALEKRKPEHPVNELFVGRWSPRAMSGEEISDQELMTLFEAAKWAPSSSNEQPWRFMYAKKNTQYWDVFFNLLTEGNKRWCHSAAVLVVMVSKKRFTKYDSDNVSAQFSTGSAFENLALQGSMMGLVVHGMGGFDYSRARSDLGIPDGYDVLAMCAIGKHGRVEDLTEKDRMQEIPSDRKPLKETVFEGKFRV